MPHVFILSADGCWRWSPPGRRRVEVSPGASQAELLEAALRSTRLRGEWQLSLDGCTPLPADFIITAGLELHLQGAAQRTLRVRMLPAAAVLQLQVEAALGPSAAAEWAALWMSCHAEGLRPKGSNPPSAHAPVASCAGCAWAAGASSPARVTGTTLRGRRRRHRRRRRRHRPLVLVLTPCSPCSSTFTCSSRRSFSFRKMHTDMGDERGIRLRCICLGRAAPRGSRMRGMGRCGKGSESRIARSSLSIARSSVCAVLSVSAY